MIPTYLWREQKKNIFLLNLVANELMWNKLTLEQAKVEWESRKSSNFMPGIVFIRYSDMLLPAKPGSWFVCEFPPGLGGEGVEGGLESGCEESRTGFLFFLGDDDDNEEEEEEE